MQLATTAMFRCDATLPPDVPRDGKWAHLHTILDRVDGYSWAALQSSPCAWLNRFFGDVECMRNYVITDLLHATPLSFTFALRSTIDGGPYVLSAQIKTKTRNPRREWQAGRYFQARGWAPAMVCHGRKFYEHKVSHRELAIHLTVMGRVAGTLRELLRSIADATPERRLALDPDNRDMLASLLLQLQAMFTEMANRGVSHNDMTIDNIGVVFTTPAKTSIRLVLINFHRASLDYADVRSNLVQLVRYLSGPIGLKALKNGALWTFTNEWSKHMINYVGKNEEWQDRWVRNDPYRHRHPQDATAYAANFAKFVNAMAAFNLSVPAQRRKDIAKQMSETADALQQYAATRYADYARYIDETPWKGASRWAERQIEYGRTYDYVKKEAMPYQANIAAEMHTLDNPRRLLAGLMRLLSDRGYYGGNHFERNICYMKSASDGLVPRMLLTWDATGVPEVVDPLRDLDHMDWFFRHNMRNGNLYHPLEFMLGDEHYAQQLHTLATAQLRRDTSTCSGDDAYLPIVVTYRLIGIPQSILARFPHSVQSRSTVALVRIGQRGEVCVFEPGLQWPTLLGIAHGIRSSIVKHLGASAMVVRAYTSLPPPLLPVVSGQGFAVETLWKEDAVVVQAFPTAHSASWARLNGTALTSLMFAFCVGTMNPRGDASRTLPQVAYAMCTTAPYKDIYKLAAGFFRTLKAQVTETMAYDTVEATFAVDACPRFVNADASDVRRFLLLGQEPGTDDLDINEELNAAVMPDLKLLRALRGPDQLGIYAPIESLLYPFEIGSADDVRFLSHSQKLVTSAGMQEAVWRTLVSSPAVASRVDLCGRVPDTRHPLHLTFTLAEEDTLRETIGDAWDGDMTRVSQAMVKLHRKRYPDDFKTDDDLAAKVKSPDIHKLRPLPTITVGYVRDTDQLRSGRQVPASLRWLNGGGLKASECASKQWLAIGATVQIPWLQLTHNVMVLIDRRAGHAYLFDPNGSKAADFGGHAAWAFVVMPTLYQQLMAHGLAPDEWRTTSLVQTEASYGPMVAQMTGTSLEHGQRHCFVWSVIFFHLFLVWGHEISPQEIYRRMLEGFLPQDLGQIVGRYGAWLSTLTYDRIENDKQGSNVIIRANVA